MKTEVVLGHLAQLGDQTKSNAPTTFGLWIRQDNRVYMVRLRKGTKILKIPGSNQVLEQSLR